MSLFTGMYIADESGEPEEFSEAAAEQIVKTVTEPIQIIPTENGKFYVKVV